MSVEDAFFKIRPTKRSNPEARTTLDALHQAQMNAIQTRIRQKDDLILKKDQLGEELEKTTDDVVYEKLEQQFKELNVEIEKREQNTEILDYFLESSLSILVNAFLYSTPSSFKFLFISSIRARVCN